ncbi:ribonuclease H-like domain-containing protein [Tanacetum coccineum]
MDIDDLYNNLRVYEDEMKKSSTFSSNTQNLAFLSSENTNSTNEVRTASGDFGMDGDDLEELDLRWQVAMLTVRVKKFIQRTGTNMDYKEKRLVSLDKLKIECYNCHRKGHFARECRSGRSQGRRPYGLDEYAFRNKIIESKTTKTNKTVGNTNEATIVKPKSVNETVMSKSKINRDEVIIEDWTSNDRNDCVSCQHC